MVKTSNRTVLWTIVRRRSIFCLHNSTLQDGRCSKSPIAKGSNFQPSY
ncbi:hypothetical protein MANES_12G119602v8 [Manihot esculenta]|uniref:Uncharacterized protein n=1 Tax=Manihot esculenta TaxID=3983 RepID=A0ACB7GSX0_MANES|nr:hypothetical protein MANES_12G119602v8 [Manihot esculenta]